MAKKQIKEIVIKTTSKGGREASQELQSILTALNNTTTAAQRFETQFNSAMGVLRTARSATNNLAGNLNKVSSEVTGLGSAFQMAEQGVDRSINSIIESFDILAMKADEMSTVMQGLSESLDKVDSSDTTEGMARMSDQLDQVIQGIDTLNNTIGGILIGQLEDLEQKSQEQVDALGALAEGMEDLDGSTQRTNKALREKAQIHEQGSKSTRAHAVEVSKFTNDTRRLSGAGSQQARAFSDLAFKMNPLVTTYAKIAVNVYALSEAFRVLNNAANLDRLENQTANFSAALTGINIRQVGRDLERMTGYAIETGDALSTVVRLSSLNFTRQEIEQLAFQMRKAALATGVDFSQAVERAIRGVSSLRTEVFQELGIFVNLEQAMSRYKVQHEAVGRELSGMEKRQALLNAVLEEAEDRFGAFDTAATNLERLRTASANFLDTSIKAIANALNPLISRTNIYSEVLGRAVTSNQKAAEAIGVFNTAASQDNLPQAIIALHEYSAAMEDVRNNVGAYGEVGGELEKRLEAQTRIQRNFNIVLGITAVYLAKVATTMAVSYAVAIGRVITSTAAWIASTKLYTAFAASSTKATYANIAAIVGETGATTANTATKATQTKAQMAVNAARLTAIKALAVESGSLALNTTAQAANTKATLAASAAYVSKSKAMWLAVLPAIKFVAAAAAITAVVVGTVAVLWKLRDSLGPLGSLISWVGSVVKSTFSAIGSGFEWLSKKIGLSGIADTFSGLSDSLNPEIDKLDEMGKQAVQTLDAMIQRLQARTKNVNFELGIETMESRMDAFAARLETFASATPLSASSLFDLPTPTPDLPTLQKDLKAAEEAYEQSSARVAELAELNRRAARQALQGRGGNLPSPNRKLYDQELLAMEEHGKKVATLQRRVNVEIRKANKEMEDEYSGLFGIDFTAIPEDQREKLRSELDGLMSDLRTTLGDADLTTESMAQIIKEIGSLKSIGQDMQNIVSETRRTETPLQRLTAHLQSVAGAADRGFKDASLKLGADDMLETLKGLSQQGALTAEAFKLISSEAPSMDDIRKAWELTAHSITNIDRASRRFAANMQALDLQSPFQALADANWDVNRSMLEQQYIQENLNSLVGAGLTSGEKRVETVEQLLALSIEDLQNVQGLNAEMVTALGLQLRMAKERAKTASAQRAMVLAEREMAKAMERNRLELLSAALNGQDVRDAEGHSRARIVELEIQELEAVKRKREELELSTDDIEHQIELLRLRKGFVEKEEEIERSLATIRDRRLQQEAQLEKAGSEKARVEIRKQMLETSWQEIELIADANQRRERRLELLREEAELERAIAGANYRDIATSANAIASLEGLTGLQSTLASTTGTMANIRAQMKENSVGLAELLKSDLQAFADFAGSILSTTSGMFQELSSAKVAAIDREIEAEKRRDGQSEESLAKIKALEAKKIKEEAKSKKASVIMSTATAVMQAFSQMGPIVGAPFAAAMTAMGLFQISQINKAMSGQLAGLDGGGSSLSLSGGSRSNSIDVAKKSNAGELAFLSGRDGMGTSGNFTPGRAGGGYAASGTRIRLGESGPEEIVPEIPVRVKPAGQSNGEAPMVFAPVFHASAIDTRGMEDLFHEYSRELYDGLDKELRARRNSTLENIR